MEIKIDEQHIPIFTKWVKQTQDDVNAAQYINDDSRSVLSPYSISKQEFEEKRREALDMLFKIIKQLNIRGQKND